MPWSSRKVGPLAGGALALQAGGPRIEDVEAASNCHRRSSQSWTDLQARLTHCHKFEKTIILLGVHRLLLFFGMGAVHRV
jgi:hypothetical protein